MASPNLPPGPGSFRPDYLVVGAGSAGCVLAARLSEDPSNRVLLIEAGGHGRDPLLRVPLMTGLLLRGRRHVWRFATEAEAGLDGRNSAWPRGKVLGGSSAINGMVYMRGRPSDYDSWAQRGLAGWRWDDVLPLFRRSERFEHGASEYHGGDGPMPDTRSSAASPLLDAFVEAGVQAGFPRSTDFGAPPFEGFGRYHFTIANGERWSAARAFLSAQVRARPNLRIATGIEALRVVLDGTRCIGVEVAQGGGTTSLLRPERETILCAGAIGSPALLQHGGIGAPELLEAAGIPVRHALPGVGRNLQDHLLVRVEHACTQPITLHALARADRAVLALLQAMLLKTGPAASFPLAAGALIRSRPGLEEPDLQSHILPALGTAMVRLPFATSRRSEGHGFMANVYSLRPDSRGEVAVASADPRQKPRIRANYLSAPADRERLREGVRILRRVFAQPAFNPFRGAELSPGPSITTDAELDAWIARTADTAFHPIGTCTMGADGDIQAVLDEALRVRGIAGLRVADASAMPLMPSGNTHAPTMMIAERCAELLL